MNGQKHSVANDRPVIGKYNVNNEGSTDMYYKGAQLLNTLRHVLNDDEKWWKILLNYSETYRHQIIDTPTVISFFNTQFGQDLSPIFDQYLNYRDIPELIVEKNKKEIRFKWKTDIANFKMPVVLFYEGKEIRLDATNDWKFFKVKDKKDVVSFDNSQFFIKVDYNL